MEDVVESWANQPGYPLVTVTRNYTTGVISASQKRFYLYRPERRTDSEESDWWIPLTLISEGSNSTRDPTVTAAWLRPRVNGTTVGRVEPSAWVIVNVEQVGFYRVNYDDSNWQMLTDRLKTDDLPRINAINRAVLLDDAFNLGRAGYVDYTTPFQVATYLVRETEYVPWVAAVNNFNFLNRVLATSPSVQRLFQVSDCSSACATLFPPQRISI